MEFQNNLNYIWSNFLIIMILVISSQSSNPQALNLDQTTADYIFYNGDIYTIDNSFTIDEAIAIVGNKILETGSTTYIMSHYNSAGYTQLVDLDGKAILPGLIDGHTHVFGNARFNGYGIKGAQELYFQYGYTTANEKFSDEDLINKLQLSETNGTLKMRVNLFPAYNDARIDANDSTIINEFWFPANPPVTDPTKLVRVPGIKIYVDGTFSIARGAWAMSQPIPQQDMQTWLVNITTNPYGNLYFSQIELEEIVSLAQDQGYQVAFHAMGDRAIDTVANAIGNVTNGSNTQYRHQIEHNSYLRPDVMNKLVQIDSINALRGYWQFCDQTAAEVDNFFAPGYFNRTWYANRFAMPGNGIHVYLETDFVFSHAIGDRAHNANIDPFLGLWGMVARSSFATNGSICRAEPWLAQNVITVEQALRVLTIEGAYAVHMEDYIGSLEKGKYADLIVIPQSPSAIALDELKDLYPLLTMANGVIVYEHSDSDLEITRAISDSNTLSSILSFNCIVIIATIPVILSSKKYKQYKN